MAIVQPHSTPFTLRMRGEIFVLDRPWIMGILNITPDSFHPESRVQDLSQVVDHAGKMLEAGANVLDIGGQSTRPGAARISAKEEMDRVLPAIEAVVSAFPDSLISVDTFYGSVAREAVRRGATMINDISGGAFDAGLWPAVSELQVPYILMHIKGEPETMQQRVHYDDVMQEVMKYFTLKINALQNAGIRDIILDPGFGFGKRLEDNYTLLCRLDEFRLFGFPVLAGLSRKKMIRDVTGRSTGQAANASTAAHMAALIAGARILRTHDVSEAADAVAIYDAMAVTL